MGRVGTHLLTILGVGMIAPAPLGAQANCQLCLPRDVPGQNRPNRPIHIDIETILDFATAAHTDSGSGTVTLDARTGQRSFAGLVGVGGPALRGTVTITGEPFRRIVIEVPARIALNSTMGAKADITEIQTNLSPDPRIGADGRLVFLFGGRLAVRDGAAGDFHGRIQIRAEYQ